MDWFLTLLQDKSSFTHALFVYSLIIAAGIWIGHFKIRGISLGVTAVLFFALVANYFGCAVDPQIIGFFRNFGLVLFVFFIGLQVGPSFFATLRQRGCVLNGLMALAVVLGMTVTMTIYFFSGNTFTLPQLLGVHFGSIPSTPGLGATQEALIQLGSKEDIAVGYACAYPVSVIGFILVIQLLRAIFRIDLKKEEDLWDQARKRVTQTPIYFHVRMTNKALNEMTLRQIRELIGRAFICSRILHDGTVQSPTADTVVHLDDVLRIVASPAHRAAIVAFCGEEETKIDLASAHSPLVSRTIRVTREEMNGVRIDGLHLSRLDGVNIVRVLRAGVQVFPYDSLRLQIGDSVKCVGPSNSVARLASILGNQESQLERPNVYAIFLGIAAGIALGCLPIAFPGMPTAIKLGMAGGPLIAAILLSYFGPRLHLVTYTTLSANLMLREWGLAFFLASVGLGAGDTFFKAFADGIGWLYMGTGLIICMVPLLITGIIARKVVKLNFHTVAGLLAGAATSSSALSFVNSLSEKGQGVVAYSTVYPLAMFLRIISGQVILMMFW